MISIFVARMKKICILGYRKCGQWGFWSACANAQADQNLRWSHMSEGTFSVAVPHMCDSGSEHINSDLSTVIVILSFLWQLSFCWKWKNLLEVTEELGNNRCTTIRCEISVSPVTFLNITKTRLFKYTENFTTKRNESFQIKILIFFIFLIKR